jgi:hypothetical protein
MNLFFFLHVCACVRDMRRLCTLFSIWGNVWGINDVSEVKTVFFSNILSYLQNNFKFVLLLVSLIGFEPRTGSLNRAPGLASQLWAFTLWGYCLESGLEHPLTSLRYCTHFVVAPSKCEYSVFNKPQTPPSELFPDHLQYIALALYTM